MKKIIKTQKQIETGAFYTPLSFVKLQNKKLKELGYDLNEYIVFDPCAGVGNLENQFGQDYKEYCYLSTLEQMDVDTCKIKGFNTAIQFNFLEDNNFPLFKHEGKLKDIREIAKDLNRKIMIIMNPPYQRKKGYKNNLAVEFFNKCIKLKPETIVFYYQTKSFLTDEIRHYIKSKYKINSHILSDAKTTFLLSNWPVSQVIFDKNKGEKIKLNKIKVDRYEINKKTDELEYIKTYTYDNSRPNLIKEIEDKIKKNTNGMEMGIWCYLSNVINIGNKKSKKDSNNKITTKNLKYCLLSKGINFNSHGEYCERNIYCYKGNIKEIPEELFNDGIMFSLFYNKNAFSNKNGLTNYIMPFSYQELGCYKQDLNILRNTNNNDLFSKEQEEKTFDFRKFMKQFKFSKEAKELYNKALEIFRYYHKRYPNTNYNDSFYDITNTIMGKDPTQFKDLDTENDTRISKVKTTKGTRGFGRNTIKQVIPEKDLQIFYDFFDARDVLANKINEQLVENKLLLWKRENIY